MNQVADLGVVITTMAATLCMQVGFFLWKLSAQAQPRIGVAPTRKVVHALFTDWRWLGGLLMSVLGWLLFIRATSIGEISVIQPLMSTGDVVLVVMAVTFLKERLNGSEVLGLVVTIAGAGWLAMNAQAAPGAAWNGMALGGFVLAVICAVALLLVAARRHVGKEIPLALAIGLSFGAGAVLTEAWTAAAASGWRVLLHPLWLSVVAANVAGLVLLQAAFQRGRASVVVPVQLAIGNAVAVGGGVVLFAEPLPSARLAAVGLIIAGAVLLQGRATRDIPQPDNHG